MAEPFKMVFLDAATVGLVDNLAEISSLGDYTSYEITCPMNVLNASKDTT